jgi:uncharacterized protein
LTTYYADTSVLLKRHIDEPGDDWFRELVLSSNSIITTELSIVEIFSAFNRLLREGHITTDVYAALSASVRRLFAVRYALTPVSASVRGVACNVMERHPLRAYDAVHLASALDARQNLVANGIPGLIFLSADHRLLAAAAAEGLSTFDPATPS